MIRYPFHKLKSCSLDSFFDEPYGYAVNLNYPLKTLRLDARIRGPCDGLVRYDSSNDDYKVVRINNFNNSLEVKIYSLRTDSWRKIQDFPSNRIGKLMNGSLNWVGINPSDHSWVITALDLAEETYREIPQSNYGKEFSRLLVWALKGNLCVVCEDTFTFSDVWDGEILVNFGGTLVLYDLIKHIVKYRSIYGVPDFPKVEIYQESLVSPDEFMKVPIDLSN
ncbi:hypothetical protein ACSBR1_015642 [Camellia fascicularis]